MKRGLALALAASLLSACVAVTVERRRPRKGPVKEVGYVEYGGGQVRYSSEGWSWVRQLGTTSLLVYWVHIELVYGRWLGFWKDRLTIGETVIAALAVTLLMLALSVAKTTYPSWRHYLVPDSKVPKQASGD